MLSTLLATQSTHQQGRSIHPLAKAQGLSGSLTVSLTGLILGFVLTGASHYDNRPVVELLDSFGHHLQRLLGDEAYNDASLESYLEQYRSLILLAPTKVNQPAKRSTTAQKELNRYA